MQTIEFISLMTTPRIVRDSLILIVGEVPYDEMKRAYLEHSDDGDETPLINLTGDFSQTKVEQCLADPRRPILYLNRRIESAPALFHHLDTLPGGELLESAIDQIYLARYSTPDALLSIKIKYYQTLLMRRFGYSADEIKTLIHDVPTQALVLDNLRIVFNREMEKSSIPNRYLEAPELEHVRETYDPPTMFSRRRIHGE